MLGRHRSANPTYNHRLKVDFRCTIKQDMEAGPDLVGFPQMMILLGFLCPSSMPLASLSITSFFLFASHSVELHFIMDSYNLPA